jgi:hypothetical protein
MPCAIAIARTNATNQEQVHDVKRGPRNRNASLQAAFALFRAPSLPASALQGLAESRIGALAASITVLIRTCSMDCQQHVCPQVRHNEDKLNVALSARVRWPVDPTLCDDPHTKANLLLQCHLGRLALPVADYVTDTKTALDNSLRLLQAMVDVAADQGWLEVTLTLIRVIQVRMRSVLPQGWRWECLC